MSSSCTTPQNMWPSSMKAEAAEHLLLPDLPGVRENSTDTFGQLLVIGHDALQEAPAHGENHDAVRRGRGADLEIAAAARTRDESCG